MNAGRRFFLKKVGAVAVVVVVAASPLPALNPYSPILSSLEVGRLYHITVTGRWSCSGPNYQNIPQCDLVANQIKRAFIGNYPAGSN